MSVSKSQRIAKNTLMLYFRMFLIIGVSLYTTRIVLDLLGVNDYGTYNVVAGFVSMFTFLNGALSASTSRFLTFEIGRKRNNRINEVFQTSLTIHIFFGIIVFISLQIFGNWFLNNKLTIPDGRILAANYAFQFAVLSAFLTILQVPFTATIIAHEKMSIYAYLGIFEAFSKLLLVLALKYTSTDKLITYAFLMFISSIITFLFYFLYSKKSFDECSIKLLFKKNLLTKMATYSAWSIIGHLSLVLRTQGVNILLNMFFGPIANAARGLAFQISTVIANFNQSFIIAVNPQIIKNYAKGKQNDMLSLVYKSSKYSFLLLMLILIPVILELDFLLSIWLKDVPKYTLIFTKLVLINTLIDSFSPPLLTCIQATGRIKNYQFFVAGFLILNLPISYVLFQLGFQPYITFVVSIIIATISLFIRLILIKKEIDAFNIREYIYKVFLTCILIFILSCAIPIWLHLKLESNIYRAAIVTISSTILSVTLAWNIALSRSEKMYIKEKIKGLKNGQQTSS